MKVIGIIIEANPFHNGHQYFINTIKKLYKPDVLIVITSNYFTMRGEISLLSKKEKTNILLKAGCNLVVELPCDCSIQSADYFASNSIKILNNFKIDTLVCGCEENSLDNLKYFYELYRTDKFNSQLKIYLNQHLSYKKAITNTLFSLGIAEEKIKLFNEPNFTLALLYYKAIKDKGLNIELSLIKRTSSYHSIDLDNLYPSASAIRNALNNGQNVKNYIPFEEQMCSTKNATANLQKILYYKLFIENEKKSLYNNEGILNYICNNADFNKPYEEMIEALANKRYSKSYIRRVIIKYLINSNMSNPEQYSRILGFDDIGIYYIGTFSKIEKASFSTSMKLISNNIIETEKNAALLYGLITSQKQIIYEEYQIPFRKDNLVK